MKKTINWALAGTGGISNRFLTGLRAVEGAHALAVVSRTRENAEAFAARYGIEKSFDSFDRMLEDPSIDAVYIGTPHTLHRDMAVKALKAKKAVLCEKPAAVNAGELGEMIQAARDNRCFFMEAMWTRFTPPLAKVREWLAQGLIGEVKVMQANFGFSAPFNPQSRLFDPSLAGGCLLDAGVYPLSLASMVFGGKKPERIVSHLYFGEAGTDEEALVILSYGGPRLAYAAAANRTAMKNDGWIYGTQGKIHLPDFVFSHSAELLLDGRYNYRYEGDFLSNGYNYETEEVMNCIREGRTESPVMSWDESLVLMETMDAVRAQWNYKYPGEKG
ncbi:MAG: Gfo/Idh/MocA family oxidoreductase [Treponema sp.]|jgi:predicted dehydrogenase|nr:Gfo/Idh/MocA family oxidoreductase [Treponema sp.]